MNHQSARKNQKQNNTALISSAGVMQRYTKKQTNLDISTIDDPQNIRKKLTGKEGLPVTENPFNHSFTNIPIRDNLLPYPIQTKLKIGESNDKYEQEADKVAEQIVRIPDQQFTGIDSLPLNRMTPLIQTKTTSENTSPLTPKIDSAIQSLQGSGQPLSKADRNYFEPRFGADFSNVRIHNNQQSIGLANSINARAFTYGNNIVFGPREYSSSTQKGKRLLAHELTHVIQQNGGETVFSKDKKQIKYPLMLSQYINQDIKNSYSSIFQWQINHSRGGTLSYRDATNLSECIHIMGIENTTYCRQKVLGEPITQVSPNTELTVILNLTTPERNPSEDTRRTINRLGAWERANLVYGRSFSVRTSSGAGGSYVTMVEFNMVNPIFEYFMAHELIERAAGRMGDRGEQTCWIQIVQRIRRHAREHFTRYRDVVASTRVDILAELNVLPRRSNPLNVPEVELELYTHSLLAFWHAQLANRLWETTCEWERIDYSAISRELSCFSGRFPIDCGTAPSVPAVPLPPQLVRS